MDLKIAATILLQNFTVTIKNGRNLYGIKSHLYGCFYHVIVLSRLELPSSECNETD